MQIDRARKVTQFLNVTPLIDCVFLLLIFFLLTSSFVEETGIQVNLPEAKFSSETSQTGIEIVVTADEKISVNGNDSSLQTLEEDLKTALCSAPAASVIIKADAEVKLKFLVKVMDAPRGCGVSSVSIATLGKE